MAKDFVIIGRGSSGKALVRELARSKPNASVLWVSRSGGANPSAQVESLAADVGKDLKSKVFPHVDASTVFFMALGLPLDKWTTDFPALQTAILQDLGTLPQPPVVVFVENLYGFAKTTDGRVTLDTPLKSFFPMGVARQTMTQEWMEAHKAGKIRAASVMASDFYGPACDLTNLGPRSIYAMWKQPGATPSFVDGVTQPHSVSFIDDLARAMILLASPEGEAGLGQYWILPNASPEMTATEWTHLAARVAGQEPPKKIGTISGKFKSFLGLFISPLRYMKQTTYQRDEPWIITGAAFAQKFGFQPTPAEDGMKATYEFWKAQQAEAASKGKK